MSNMSSQLQPSFSTAAEACEYLSRSHRIKLTDNLKERLASVVGDESLTELRRLSLVTSFFALAASSGSEKDGASAVSYLELAAAGIAGKGESAKHGERLVPDFRKLAALVRHLLNEAEVSRLEAAETRIRDFASGNNWSENV